MLFSVRGKVQKIELLTTEKNIIILHWEIEDQKRINTSLLPNTFGNLMDGADANTVAVAISDNYWAFKLCDNSKYIYTPRCREIKKEIEKI